MLVLGVEHWRIEENLACLLCYSKLGLNESTRCYGKLSAAVFSDEFGAKFAGECQLKINLYSVYGLPVTVAEGLYGSQILPGTICHEYEPSAGIPKESGDVKFFSCDLTWNYP